MPAWLAHVYAVAGLAASIVGAILTILQARAAKKSADQASRAANSAVIAANEARAKIKSVDWVLHFGAMTSNIDSLLHSVNEQADWTKLSAECTSLRTSALLGALSPVVVADESLKKRLSSAVRGFTSVIGMANQKIADQSAAFDLVKARRILSDQHSTFSLALHVARENAAEDTPNG